MLESLDKRNLVTPLLLYHESPEVRRRALRAIGAVRRDIATSWLPQVRRMLSDAGLRRARGGDRGDRSDQQRGRGDAVAAAARRSRLRASGVTAAVALAASAVPARRGRGRSGTASISPADGADRAAEARRDVAAAIRHIDNPRFRRLLIPLLYDAAPEVAARGDGKRAGGGRCGLHFRRRRSCRCCATASSRARRARCSSATASRSSTRSRISCATPTRTSGCGATSPPRSRRSRRRSRWTCSSAALEEPDGFLRYKVIAALERLRRTDAPLTLPARDARGAGAPRGASHYLQLSVAARQPVRERRQLESDRSSQRAPREDGADARTASTACSR